MSKRDETLNVERLNDLKPDAEQMFENTWRATKWYNEAVWTAASVFVKAARNSDEFRKEFLSEETVEVEVFPNEPGATMVEQEVWRSTFRKEFPELSKQVDSIGLSAFQGGSAEQEARRQLRND